MLKIKTQSPGFELCVAFMYKRAAYKGQERVKQSVHSDIAPKTEQGNICLVSSKLFYKNIEALNIRTLRKNKEQSQA